MNPQLRPVLVCIWLLVLVTFSAPGREGPNDAGGVDLIALTKIGIRLLTILVCARVLFLSDPMRRSRLVRVMGPWGVFIAWAGVSVLWSALPTVTIGQTIGLSALVLLGTAVAVLWRGPEDTEAILRHLTFALFTFSSIIVVVDLVAHDISGLNRDEHPFELAANGIIHPTTAGATASLGLSLVLGCWLLWGWTWTRILLIPAVPVHVMLMIFANSRMALGMAALSIGLIVLTFTPRSYLAALALVVSACGALYVALDPGLEIVESAVTQALNYVKRGESDESMSSLTGRTDLWEAIWASFLESPLIGHGYFVTSRTGLLDVWSGPANRSAHNVFLQVMVTTGLLGTALFFWAVGASGSGAVQGLWCGAGEPEERIRFGALVTVLALWYAGWSQLAESFMGGVLPESVLYFCLLGLVLGLFASEEPR